MREQGIGSGDGGSSAVSELAIRRSAARANPLVLSEHEEPYEGHRKSERESIAEALDGHDPPAMASQQATQLRHHDSGNQRAHYNAYAV